MSPKEPDEDSMTIVDISQIPSGRVKFTKWELMFQKIPAGKAWVITEGEVSLNAVRTSLYALQRKGKFKTLNARKVKELDGKYKMYVVNNAKVPK